MAVVFPKWPNWMHPEWREPVLRRIRFGTWLWRNDRTVPSANTRLALPRSSGYSHRFIRSTRPKRNGDCRRSRLPMTWTSSWRSLMPVMSSARSPDTSVETCQASGPASVRPATDLGTPLSRPVNEISSEALGQ
jgi:hypothetical protein